MRVLLSDGAHLVAPFAQGLRQGRFARRADADHGYVARVGGVFDLPGCVCGRVCGCLVGGVGAYDASGAGPAGVAVVGVAGGRGRHEVVVRVPRLMRYSIPHKDASTHAIAIYS